MADKKFMDAHIFAYEDVVYNMEEVIRVLAKLIGKPVTNVIQLQIYDKVRKHRGEKSWMSAGQRP